MSSLLRVPCSYQGGKQRIAAQVVDHLLEAAPNHNSRFYDLCCGSGAVSIELVNRGVEPSRIWMLDISTWGFFLVSYRLRYIQYGRF
ncbi:DNA adenine methylase [Bathymodiolus japonicus methanotrophic gill symbiont]|uniref:DNA adenine methylase n=1 Tax=Bathymodiolus japonicus methanotrophic gill symbiont TaxID=113269 RepID=UPI001E4881E2|nr:DNA adenine methylase [Bathymodiolus japonicus methanotrophic gill symbiont]